MSKTISVTTGHLDTLAHIENSVPGVDGIPTQILDYRS